jgi:anti-sigma B factor antagonist
LDYSGLGVLVGALRRARADGGWIRLVRPTRAVRQALGITHLDRIFPIHDTLDDATAHAAAGHAAPYGRSELPL